MSSPTSFPTQIDSSMRGAFVSCPQKFFYEYQLGLTGASSPHLVAGAAFAEGLSTFRVSFYQLQKSFEASLENAFLSALIAYGPYDPPEKYLAKSWDRVLSALAFYLETWPPQSDYIQPVTGVDGRIQVEHSFALSLPISHPETGNPILYTGRFDMIGLYQGQFYAVDEKTTSQLGASWINSWDLRAQFTGYTWALLQEGIPCNGTIVRGISFLKNSFGSAEVISFRPEHLITAWYKQLLRDIKRMIECWETSYYDRSFDQACTAYGGCPYQSLCTTANPERWITTFPRSKWDPLTGTREELPPLSPEEAGSLLR